MGTDDDEGFAADGEGPVREVTVSPFRIAECAVTNSQYATFVKATGHEPIVLNLSGGSPHAAAISTL